MSTTSQPHPLMARVRESAMVVLCLLAVYLGACLLSFDPADPGWSQDRSVREISNLGGAVGAWLADVLLSLFGLVGYLFPLVLVYAGVRQIQGVNRARGDWLSLGIAWGGFVIGLLAAAGLFALHSTAGEQVPAGIGGGGIVGELVGEPLAAVTGLLGATLLLLSLLLAAMTLFTGLSWLRVMDATGYLALNGGQRIKAGVEWLVDWWAGRRARARREEVRRVDTRRRKQRKQPRIEPQIQPEPVEQKPVKQRQRPLFKKLPGGRTPSLELLDEPGKRTVGYDDETLKAMSRQVELKLADFGVEVEVVAVHPGPVVTRFELQPAPGIKGSRISNLDKDLARALSVVSVRVIDVIPGKSVIGLEVPNARREVVYLREILESDAYHKSHSPLTLALGKDIAGNPVVADVAKMPHLLVAGTTGSGKSVAINAMILSVVYKATAEQVRMIMVDPKMLELSVYDGIPHLLAPVVTDMKEAANALRWCVAEMERRYKLMAALGVRNLSGLNRKIREARDRGEPLRDPLAPEPADGESAPELQPLPCLLVVVDEFADMMMVVGKKVEELIARLAQKARASGIHLILATQRPSVDVITGLIKANIPTRMAFQVSARVDSRTILDQGGADQLLGHGDMLYLPPGSSMTERVHGAFVDDHEVHAVAEALREQGEPEYLDAVLSDTQELAGGQVVGETGLPESAADDQDELYDRAVRIVTESRRASISGVQRQLRIGYNRAARLIEEMEAAGIVSTPQHNGQREVLAAPPPED